MMCLKIQTLTRGCARGFLTLFAILAISFLVSGCIVGGVRTVYVSPGNPVRIRKEVKAKVWVADKDGKWVQSTMVIPEGWYALSDPKK